MAVFLSPRRERRFEGASKVIQGIGTVAAGFGKAKLLQNDLENQQAMRAVERRLGELKIKAGEAKLDPSSPANRKEAALADKAYAQARSAEIDTYEKILSLPDLPDRVRAETERVLANAKKAENQAEAAAGLVQERAARTKLLDQQAATEKHVTSREKSNAAKARAQFLQEQAQAYGAPQKVLLELQNLQADLESEQALAAARGRSNRGGASGAGAQTELQAELDSLQNRVIPAFMGSAGQAILQDPKYAPLFQSGPRGQLNESTQPLAQDLLRSITDHFKTTGFGKFKRVTPDEVVHSAYLSLLEAASSTPQEAQQKIRAVEEGGILGRMIRYLFGQGYPDSSSPPAAPSSGFAQPAPADTAGFGSIVEEVSRELYGNGGETPRNYRPGGPGGGGGGY